MAAVIDWPIASKAIDPIRFNVRGWLWLGDAQPTFVAVEAWSGDHLLGQSMGPVLRPDVVRALGLRDEVKPGFDFFADFPSDLPSTAFDLTIHVRMSDGSRSAALCGVRVQTLARAGSRRSLDGDGVQASEAPGTRRACSGREPVEGESPPPDHLQIRQVGGIWGPLFFSEGRVILAQIVEAFREVGYPLERAGRVLDFGCGCGRVLRGFEGLDHGAEVWGCDIDAEAIDWSREHLGHVARFACNPAFPPTEFDRGFFDAVYSVSVFTHLPMELQFAWLTELRRIVRPNGFLILSTLGAHYWQNVIPEVRSEVESRGFAYYTAARTEGLPDFYKYAFHSQAYIRSSWSWFFEVVTIKEKFIHGLNDAVVLRRRDD
jgi:SAM-dependent methyltransferase